MAKKGKYICQNCGKDCGNPPALQLHQAYCNKKTKEDARTTECKHNFRLLNPNSVAENNALIDGYIEVCTKCKELR